jgi:hypothetical protein
MIREWNELHGSPETEKKHGGGLHGMTEEIRRENERRRRAFDEAAAKYFPQSRQNETVRKIVENRKRFERMAEACFPAARIQDSWRLQTASSSWGFSRNEGLGRG